MLTADAAQQIADRKADRWLVIALAIISAWIIACIFLVQGEYGDGYLTIVNAQYFFGDSPGFYVQRGPLPALVLWPIEAIVQVLELNPLDVRPYHVLSALIHIGYLYVSWQMLRRAPGSGAARLLAFATAILTVVFYAYAPYLSHDLVPGLLFLGMVFLAHRWLQQPSWGISIALIVVGAGVTLIKQTYAIFWISIVAFVWASWLLRADGGRIGWRAVLSLTSLAACSAVISWCSYAWFIGGELPDEPFFNRPIRVAIAITEQYRQEALADIFPADLYLRNLHNYGIASVLLIVPGLWLALRGKDPRMRMIGTCWLIAAISMQATGFREARYLAYLAPLSAMLIVPVIQHVIARRDAIALAVIALVLFDQSRGLTIAAEQITTSPRTNVTRLINAPNPTGRVFSSNVLSVVYDASSPFQRDRYHGIYHLTPIILHRLYEGRLPVATFIDQLDLGNAGMQPGDRVYLANYDIVRRPPWQPMNVPVLLDEYVFVAGNVATVRLLAEDGEYVVADNDGRWLMFLPAADAGQQLPVIASGFLTAQAAGELYGELEMSDDLEVSAVVIEAICQADACSYAAADR